MAATFQSLGELGDWLAAQSSPAGPLFVADPGIPLSDYLNQGGTIWASQPSVRKVVDFVARNIASIPFHAYDRVSDTDRERVTDHPLAAVMSRPSLSPGVTPFRFWHAILVDWLIFDRWAAMKVSSGDRVDLRRIPARRFRFITDGLEQITAIQVWNDDGTSTKHRPSKFVFDTGYGGGGGGTSPMEAIRHLLEETSESIAYRRSVWKNGGRIPAVIERDKPWSSDTARERFVASWAAFNRGGGREGGTPILEDGMKLAKADTFTPRDAQDLEGRKLTDIEVASFYHLAPELVGAREGTYSNVDAFRQMLYRDSLGPYITALEQAINIGLVDDFAEGRSLYIEAHVEAKLRGSFIEQAQVLSTATGRPWMVTDEARARMNMPALGGDATELVTPLNVVVGGQASPRDSGSQNLGGGELSGRPLTKAAKVDRDALDGYDSRAAKLLSDFFARQARVVKGALGVKQGREWWDAERWDRELSADLFRVADLVTAEVAAGTLRALGIEPDEYDPDRTYAFLAAVSERIAGQVNATTFEQIEDALTDDDPDEAVKHVFEVAETSRAEKSGLTAVTTFSGFAAAEAVKQTGGEQSTKTWQTTSGNPRASHAAMNGETVLVSENFSNGLAWPGDANGDADEVAGCHCSLIVNLPD